jgi:FAD/FMN-containing dehydrogenase
MDDYTARRERLSAQIRNASGGVAIKKATSNLFRLRERTPGVKLDVHDFNHVLEVDATSGWVDAEGMTSYENLVLATLACGVMPAVVPQLKTITIGGAVAGVGIEASSFRHGLVHENILELEVLAGDGNIYLCTPKNEHADLFFGLANSYGTLGYALRVRSRTLPVKKFVKVEHRRFTDAMTFFDALARAQSGAADFLDGVVFASDELYVVSGTFVDEAPYVSDYTFEQIYYQSIRLRQSDFLTTHDFLWRWDTDWFWCSKNFGMQIPFVRRHAGKARLNSRTYTRWMHWNNRLQLTRGLNWLLRRQRESVIQDVDIPMHRAAEFLEFLHKEIGILPVWICPIRAGAKHFPLYPLNALTSYVNFGFWDAVKTSDTTVPGHFNRLIERKVANLGGIKSLYSDSYFPREEFDAIYSAHAYRELKARYDPLKRLPDLYDKTVLRK